MTYKIAAASSDNQYIDLHFGSAEQFFVYEVDEKGCHLEEVRLYAEEDDPAAGEPVKEAGCSCRCSSFISGKADLISDCRFLLCAAAGPGAVRQLEARGITVFDIAIEVKEGIETIVKAYSGW